MGAAPEFSATLALTFALTVLSGNARGLYDRRPHAPMGGPPATRYLRRPITRLSWRPRGPATGQASRPRAEAAPAPDAAPPPRGGNTRALARPRRSLSVDTFGDKRRRGGDLGGQVQSTSRRCPSRFRWAPCCPCGWRTYPGVQEHRHDARHQRLLPAAPGRVEHRRGCGHACRVRARAARPAACREGHAGPARRLSEAAGRSGSRTALAGLAFERSPLACRARVTTTYRRHKRCEPEPCSFTWPRSGGPARRRSPAAAVGADGVRPGESADHRRSVRGTVGCRPRRRAHRVRHKRRPARGEVEPVYRRGHVVLDVQPQSLRRQGRGPRLAEVPSEVAQAPSGTETADGRLTVQPSGAGLRPSGPRR